MAPLVPATRLALRGCGFPARLEGRTPDGPAIQGPWCASCALCGACPVAADLAGAIVVETARGLLLQEGSYTAHPAPISPAHAAWLGRTLPVVEHWRSRHGLDLHLRA